MYLKQLSHSLFSTLPLSGGGDYVIVGGRKYHYVKIGNQLWTNENLDYIDNNIHYALNRATIPNAYYYSSDGIDYTQWGLLYNYYAVEYFISNATSIFPRGWKIPSRQDFNTLETQVGGQGIAGLKLKSTSEWYYREGTDDFGFNLRPAGCYYNGDAYSKSKIYEQSRVWLNAPIDSSNAENRYFTDSNDNSKPWGAPKTCYGSIRLVRDVA